MVHQSSKNFCGICLDFKGAVDMFREGKCKHPFCIDCITKHVAAQIQQNRLEVNCPNPSCDVELKPNYLKSILPKEVVDRWECQKCESSIALWQKIYCPFKDCSILLVNDGDGGNVVTSCECPYCHRLFCAQCKVPWHAGLNCKEFQVGKRRKGEEDLDQKFLELANIEMWQKCPKCSFYVQKHLGCDHITCRCGCNFCYMCGKDWAYEHVCNNLHGMFHRSYSPDYNQHRPYSPSPDRSMSETSNDNSYNTYDDYRDYSPDYRYYRPISRSRSPRPRRSYPQDVTPIRRLSSRRSYTPSISPRPSRRRRRSYSRSVTRVQRLSSRRSYSRSVSPRPRRSQRRSYSRRVSPRPRKSQRRSYARSVTPIQRLNSRKGYSRSISPRPRRSQRRSYSRSVTPVQRLNSRRGHSRSISPRQRRSQRRSYSRSVTPVQRLSSRRSYSRSVSPRPRRSQRRSSSRRVSPRPRSQRRSYARSVTPVQRLNSRKGYSRSISPRPRRSQRRSYSRSVTPIQRLN